MYTHDPLHPANNPFPVINPAPVNYPIPVNYPPPPYTHYIHSTPDPVYDNQAVRPWIRDQSEIRRGDNVPLHLFGNHDGFFLGGKMCESEYWSGTPLKPVIIPPGSNICLFGNSGTGKSTRFINPTLKFWDGSMLVVDINGTSADFYAALRKQRPFKILNMMEGRDTIFRYDPFHLIRRTPGLARKIIRKLVFEIIPISATEDSKSKYFLNTARNILQGALIYHYNLNPDSCFIDSLIAINDTPLEVLLSKIDEKVKRRYMSQIIGIKNRDENGMVASVMSVMYEHLLLLIENPEVVELFTVTKDTPPENIVTWEDIETHNLFIAVHENDVEEKASAIRLLLSGAIHYFKSRPDKHCTLGEQLVSVLFLLDELPLYKRLESLETAIATLRKRNVSTAFALQDLSQIEEHYGVIGRRKLLSNCDYQVLLGTNDLESLKYFSERIGSIIVAQRSCSESRKADWSEIPNHTMQVSESREPIFYPTELANLENEAILIYGGSFCKILKIPMYMKYKEDERNVQQ